MGRVKLKIKRLESTSNRQVTYSKRRNGILKKARELSILCDIEIILLMFSPTGRPTLFHGARSNIEEVIAKFAQLTPQERAKRKLESLEALKKTFKKLDHDVNLQDFLGASTQTIEELTNQARLLQAQLTEVHKRLRCILWAYDCYWVLLVIWVITVACNGSAMKFTASCYVIRAHIFYVVLFELHIVRLHP